MPDRERRRIRNCDGFTNRRLLVDNVGLVWTCPNAIDGRSAQAFRWWLMWRSEKLLPYSGFDFMGQPFFVVQAIRECDAELERCHRRMNPPKGGKRPPLTYPKEIDDALKRAREGVR